MSKNGETVTAFERALADYCGARFAVSASNGTVTLQAALVALGVKPGDRVVTTPLTHAATTIAILNVGAVPVYRDVHPDTWLMMWHKSDVPVDVAIPVSLYGLHLPVAHKGTIDDAAQTLRRHDSGAAFTSLSFQASKILSTGEGGALLTDDETLAEKARSYLSLGYKMSATQSRIDSNAIKSPTFDRHHSYPSVNGRMNDLTAAEGLRQLRGSLRRADQLIGVRRHNAERYSNAIEGCNWLTPQHVPEGWRHDYWTFAVACDSPERANLLASSVVKYKGEAPYGCWKLTYQEPAFRHLAPDGTCPIAESLQPRLLQFQTNNLQSAERNARALRLAIQEIGAE